MDDANRGRLMTETRAGDRHRTTITMNRYGDIEVTRWDPSMTETTLVSNEARDRISSLLLEAVKKVEDMEEDSLVVDQMYATLNTLRFSFVEREEC